MKKRNMPSARKLKKLIRSQLESGVVEKYTDRLVGGSITVAINMAFIWGLWNWKENSSHLENDIVKFNHYEGTRIAVTGALEIY